MVQEVAQSTRRPYNTLISQMGRSMRSRERQLASGICREANATGLSSFTNVIQMKSQGPLPTLRFKKRRDTRDAADGCDQRARFGNLNPWPNSPRMSGTTSIRRERPPNVPVHTLELQPEDVLFAGPSSSHFVSRCAVGGGNLNRESFNLAKTHLPHTEPLL